MIKTCSKPAQSSRLEAGHYSSHFSGPSADSLQSLRSQIEDFVVLRD
jgi:hypothetical protein